MCKSKTWFVYILRSKKGGYYVGMTSDVEKRLREHNSGRGAKYAKDNGELKLVYKSEPYSSKTLARRREMQIKKWTRVKKEKLIRGEWS